MPAQSAQGKIIPTFEELLARVEKMEELLKPDSGRIDPTALDFAALQRRLENRWEPAGGVLLSRGSVGTAELADEAATTRKVLLDTQRVYSPVNANYNSHGGPGNVTVTRGPGAGGGNLELSYTPPVDAWWELYCNVGLIQKNDAAWGYMVLRLYNTVGLVPPVPGLHPGRAAGGVVDDGLAYDIGASHNALPYIHLVAKTRIPVSAGVPYTIQAVLTAGAGNWSYWQGAAMLYFEGAAYAR